MDTVLYDSSGTPVAYIEGESDIYLFTGEPIAYINHKSIYGYSGSHLGWFDEGWVRDHSGACVLFSSGSTGSGPVKPVTRLRPVAWQKRIKPNKGTAHKEPPPPPRKLSWSALSPLGFFHSTDRFG